MSTKEFFQTITRRYGKVEDEALKAVLCPLLVPIKSIDPKIFKAAKQSHYRASFTVEIDDTNRVLMQRGRTGKFVPISYLNGGPWQEIAKGRIIEVDPVRHLAHGEIYTGRQKNALESALSTLTTKDYLEIDQFGAAAKVLSALVEYNLTKQAIEKGYKVRRMPEDIARHLGSYFHYDFEFEKNGVVKKIEVKSLWGTNTNFARLIHSKGGTYSTSSCKFETQDIFAVSLFLRTGNVADFAFCRSVPKDEKKYGLPRSPDHPTHVHQNPPCAVGDGTWFASIDEVWGLR